MTTCLQVVPLSCASMFIGFIEIKNVLLNVQLVYEHMLMCIRYRLRYFYKFWNHQAVKENWSNPTQQVQKLFGYWRDLSVLTSPCFPASSIEQRITSQFSVRILLPKIWNRLKYAATYWCVVVCPKFKPTGESTPVWAPLIDPNDYIVSSH